MHTSDDEYLIKCCTLEDEILFQGQVQMLKLGAEAESEDLRLNALTLQKKWTPEEVAEIAHLEPRVKMASAALERQQTELALSVVIKGVEVQDCFRGS